MYAWFGSIVPLPLGFSHHNKDTVNINFIAFQFFTVAFFSSISIRFGSCKLTDSYLCSGPIIRLREASAAPAQVAAPVSSQVVHSGNVMYTSAQGPVTWKCDGSHTVGWCHFMVFVVGVVVAVAVVVVLVVVLVMVVVVVVVVVVGVGGVDVVAAAAASVVLFFPFLSWFWWLFWYSYHRPWLSHERETVRILGGF